MGRRTAGVVVEAASTSVSSFLVVRVTLDDGRSVTASPGHPTADGKALADYHSGDVFDGASVVVAEKLVYSGSATYDLLPSGTTCLYWADHILLKSTLAAN
jgi:hypothetical protein